jgi:hypothetical protein
LVIRGINKPFAADFISSSDEASGKVVPMPAGPVEGKVFCDLAAIPALI